MEKVKNIKDNNAGYSLFEAIVTVAIISIAAVAIYQMLIASSAHYQMESREVQIQQEAQTVMNQLNDFLIDANKDVSYAGNVLTITNADAVYIITYNATDKKLLYTEKDASGAVVIADALMAEYVESFSVDLSDATKSGCIYLKAKFKNVREYEVAQTVRLRNSVKINGA